jgi:hypothetical protein
LTQLLFIYLGNNTCVPRVYGQINRVKNLINHEAGRLSDLSHSESGLSAINARYTCIIAFRTYLHVAKF